MKSPNIESLYANLDKSIKLAESYSEINNLAFIIKACRLKPFDYMKNKTEKTILYRKWFDEFGNSFNITKNKKIEIIYGDLSIKTLCTDIYHGLSLFKISKMSKLIFLIFGKEDDYHEECYLISFLGIDNYLRAYLYIYNEWRQVSPLMLGIDNLLKLAKNLDMKYFYKLQNKKNFVIPCPATNTWLSFMPASEKFIELVRCEAPYILPLLTKDY